MNPDDQTIAAASLEFLTEVTEIAEAKKIPPSVIVRLFGLFAKKLADFDTEQGMDEQQAFLHVIGQFMLGLGMTPAHMFSDPDHKDFH